MMAIEYERRFLVKPFASFDTWRAVRLQQLYTCGFRLRRATDLHVATTPATYMLTVKRPTADPAKREELEQVLDPALGEKLFSSLWHLWPTQRTSVVKTRHFLVSAGLPGIWTVDVFEGDNEGLRLLEVEGPEDEVRRIQKPEWCAAEVTNDGRFTSKSLSERPYKLWRADWGVVR